MSDKDKEWKCALSQRLLLFTTLIVIVLFFDFNETESSWYLESSFTNYLFTVSNNLSWKYKYIKYLHSKGKLYTYDYRGCSKPAKLSIRLKRWRLFDKEESESACKAHNMILTPVSILNILLYIRLTMKNGIGREHSINSQ